ncbi:MFS transporter [Longispora albida]|uniref:MFS transporter n=1 Tax=Longispora albida TaxID=203523 RepID=UPI000378003B|nr:MFS transporter [Longispora albida]
MTEGPARPAIVSLMAASVASQSLIVVLAPAMVRVAGEFSAPVGMVSQARSFTAVAAIAVSALLGPVIGRLGPGRVIAAGATVAVVACAVIGLSGTLWLFLGAHLLAGIAIALLLSASFAGAAASGEHRARALGLVAGANSLAWIAVNPLSGFLTEALSWRLAYCVPAAAALGALATARHAPAARHTEPSGTSLRALLAIGPARNWLLAELAAYSAWTAVLTFTGPLLVQRDHVPESVTGVALGLGAGAFFLTSTSGFVARRPRNLRRTALGASLAVAVLSALLFALDVSPWFTVLAFCLLGASAGVRTPAATLIGVTALPGQATTLMAARTGITQLGYFLGAVASGSLLAWGGFAAVGAAVLPGMVLAGCLLAYRVKLF